MDINNLIERPSASRRNTVSSLLNDDESEYLERLASDRRSSEAKSDLPKRYAEVPIWATSWPKTGFTKSSKGHNGVSDKRAPIAQDSSTSPLKMLPMSGITPYEDTTRKVTEWLYSNLVEIGEDRVHAEVELKLGTAWSKSTDRRIDLPLLTETILRPDYSRAETSFVSKVKPQQFDLIGEVLAAWCKNKEGAWTDRSHTRDTMFSVFNRPEKLRTTHDLLKSSVDPVTILKRRVADLLIYSPGDLLDVRISISLELPPDRAHTLPVEKSPETVRVKQRTSYYHPGTRFDLTTVNTEGSAEVTHEVELELDVPRLLECMKIYERDHDADAMDRFEQLVRVSIDDTRTLLRRVSR